MLLLDSAFALLGSASKLSKQAEQAKGLWQRVSKQDEQAEQAKGPPKGFDDLLLDPMFKKQLRLADRKSAFLKALYRDNDGVEAGEAAIALAYPGIPWTTYCTEHALRARSWG